MFSNLRRIQMQHSSGTSKSHPYWIRTCPCMPTTLEGGGTISQLSNATAEKSCTVKGHSQFDECKTKRQSTLRLQYIVWGRVMNETTVCSQRAEWSTQIELSCWLSSWREIQSTLELCDQTLRVQAYWWLWKILQQHWYKRQCSFPLSSLLSTVEPREQVVHPTPQTSMQTQRNPTSQQSPADSQQYKTTKT